MPALLIIGEPLSYVLWLWPRDMTDGDVLVQFVRVISLKRMRRMSSNLIHT